MYRDPFAGPIVSMAVQASVPIIDDAGIRNQSKRSGRMQ